MGVYPAVNTKKILAVADSHGRSEDSISVLVETEKPTLLVHLGDLVDKGGNEADKSSFEKIISVLEKNPSMDFVHISEERDSYGKFDILVQHRKNPRGKLNSFTGSSYKRGSFLMYHNIYGKDEPIYGDEGDIVGYVPGLKQEVKDDIGKWYRKGRGLIVLYGHTHNQGLGDTDGCPFSERFVPRNHQRENSHWLHGNDVWFINPGSLMNSQYCIIQKTPNGHYATFKSFSETSKEFRIMTVPESFNWAKKVLGS